MSSYFVLWYHFNSNIIFINCVSIENGNISIFYLWDWDWMYFSQMANQWIKYINNFDKLVEKALRVCCKNSLETMYEAVHGDDITGPNPLLKLVVNLKENTVRKIISLQSFKMLH